MLFAFPHLRLHAHVQSTEGDAKFWLDPEVERPQPHPLYWPQLDVDLAVESIERPERYPLISKVSA